MGFVSLLVRSGLVVGAVYYSKEAGVWDNAERTDAIYNSVKDEVRPHVRKIEQQLPFEVPSLPPGGEVRYLAKHYYNEGVKNTFHFIHMVPCYAGQLMKKAKTSFEEFAQSPTPSQ